MVFVRNHQSHFSHSSVKLNYDALADATRQNDEYSFQVESNLLQVVKAPQVESVGGSVVFTCEVRTAAATHRSLFQARRRRSSQSIVSLPQTCTSCCSCEVITVIAHSLTSNDRTSSAASRWSL